MSEPPGSGPLQNPEASLEDIRRAFEALTEADWVKLDAYAEFRIRVVGMSAPGRDACHLFMQALNSLETGRRHWYPGNVDLVKFLTDTMWSISSNWARRRETTGYVEIPETDLVEYSEQGEELDSVLEQARSQDANPEEQLIGNDFQTQEQLAEEIKNLFKDKPLAFLIIDGWTAGMKGREIIEALNIDENQYRTATRLVRRRIKDRWPNGMPNVR
jgi:hypothetical protein